MRPFRPVVPLLAGAVGFLACVAHSRPSVPADSAPPPAGAGALEHAAPSTLDRRAQVWLGPRPGLKRVETRLRTVYAPDPQASEVSVCTSYGVGSRDDPENRPGLAELVQLLSEISPETAVSDSFAGRIPSRGGHRRSRVTPDFTQFCVAAPRSALELLIQNEADRLREPRYGEDKLERALALLSERRARSLAGYELGVAKLRALAFQGYSAYAATLSPNADALVDVSHAEISAFHARYYRPENAVVSVAGDFEPAQAADLIAKYFGPSTRSAEVERSALPPLPAQTSERFATVDAPGVETPAVFIGWTLPDLNPRERAALLVARELLGGGPASLLAASVGPTGLAGPPEARLEQHTGPAFLAISLVAAKGTRLEPLERSFEGLLGRLQQSGPTPAELDAALRELAPANQDASEPGLERAERQGERVTLPEVAHAEEQLMTVTREDVRRLMALKLVRPQRAVVELYPPEMLKPPPVVPVRFHVVSSGETLTAIARRYGVTVDMLAKTNDIKTAKAIHPGQKLKLPAGSKRGTAKKAAAPRIHKVKKGDTLSGIAKRYGVSVKALAERNGQNSKKPLRIGQTLTLPPPR